MKSVVLTSFLLLQVYAGYSNEQVVAKAVANPKGDSAAAEPAARPTAIPAYPGGNEAFLSFIRKNIKYPLSARTKKTQGQVTVRFMVDADGTVKNAAVPIGKGIGDGCDEEAVRVVMLSSNWKPALRMGMPAAIWYEVPVTFTLTEMK